MRRGSTPSTRSPGNEFFMMPIRPRSSILRLGALVLALLASGCATSLHTPYAAPSASVPAQWQYGATSASGTATATRAGTAVHVAPLAPWWSGFNDPVLNQLVDQALLRNNDLAAAAIRVRRAQLQVGLAENQFGPTFSGNVSSGASRALNGGGTARSSGISLGASYAVDLWNRLGSQRDVAQWEALATVQDREATALSLVATTAQLYWQIGYLNQRLAANLQSIAVAQKTLELVQVQYRTGAVSGLELAEAQQNLSSQQASQTTLQQQRVKPCRPACLTPPCRPWPPACPPACWPAAPTCAPPS
jgi:outer membrane protein TolC